MRVQQSRARTRAIGAIAHLGNPGQHVLTAGAMNLVRLSAWLAGEPPEETGTSRFARLRRAG